MPKRAMHKEIWDLMVQSYREAPGVFSRAARLAGVDRRTAREAWERGLPHYPWGAIPIREILEGERAEAMAQVQREKAQRELARRAQGQEAADLARAQGVAAMADEIKATEVARKLILGDLAVVSTLVPTAKRMSDDLRTRIDAGEKINIRDTTAFFRALGMVTGQLTEALRAVQEVRRKNDEKPDLVVQVDGAPRVTSLAEVAEEIRAANELMNLARELKLDLEDPTPRVVPVVRVEQAPPDPAAPQALDPVDPNSKPKSGT